MARTQGLGGATGEKAGASFMSPFPDMGGREEGRGTDMQPKPGSDPRL